MRERIVKRYNECFKPQVIQDLENGRFSSITAAQEHHGITGTRTVRGWLKKFGKNDLKAKVVRVEKSDEQDRIREYKKRIAQLEQALGQTQAENVLNATFLKLACEQLGQEVESFKKKSDGKQFTPPEKSNRVG